MKRLVYASAIALLCMWAEAAMAQLAASINHRTPLQRQQFLQAFDTFKRSRLF